MDDEFGRRVRELRRDAEALIERRQQRAREEPARKTRAGEALNLGLEAIGGDIEEAIEDLETALNDLSELTEDQIAKHPIASVAAAFAIGVLIGRLTTKQG